MVEKKGIELVNTSNNTEVSITIGNTTLAHHGHPAGVRLEQDMAYVYLALDTSASMEGIKLEQAKRGALIFGRDAFNKGYQVGLISFSSSAKNVCTPTNDFKVFEKQIKGMQASGSTNMAEAIKMAHYHLDKKDKTQVIVIATDGRPDNKRNTIKEAEKAKADNIDIITIGTDDAEQDFLKKLATRAELGSKVTREVFSQAISDASRLLPPPKSITRR
ncbi:MAG: VWA domain-containing protein [Dehalococcoidales bacterium]|jgi:Mg-chelatase subunit ChlD|nr:VWA domain-containing protein [Dehalococcoidales bacterium]MDD3264550.1 VWA domain-containing protein [Dehalococcoidales bacterium]MDD4322392.1 VWA domain-containing protein [Dehalococcoidales bacterium]MDD4794010.1 VWA domain-containing protein [Dehalococcoidales bacterium]MDD5498415.1 VWA domain-containing protein [Dehalococcoidales bacterium]